MFKSYFKTALRNLRRNALFSLFNILGLSIGISASLVIYIIVQYDFSFDRFEKGADRIYRVVSEISFPDGNTVHARGVPGPLAAAVEKELPGLEEAVAFRYFRPQNLAIPSPDGDKPKVFKNQSDVIFADAKYFNLLSYKWLAGAPGSALEEPQHVVLTETRAKLYFPSLSYDNIIGKRIVYNDTITTVVSGVVEDLDKTGNTDFSFLEFISLPTLLNNPGLRNKFAWDKWGATSGDQQLYIRLAPATAHTSVEGGLKTLFTKYKGEDARKNRYKARFLLQPLSDIHFNHDYGTFHPVLASKPGLYGLILVAFFLLFLGCINFINLTTANSSQRGKEIGIRKTMGSSKAQLMMQFLSETFLTTVFSTMLSLALLPLLMKIFADFTPAGLHFSLFSLFQPYHLLFLLVLIFLVSVLAGVYPALILSSWKPVLVLKNQASEGSGKTRRLWVREVLTVSQFFIAQFFIIGALFVGKQIQFMLNKDLGFKKEAILSFSTPNNDTSYSRRLYLLDQVRNIQGVSLASLGSDVPSSSFNTLNFTVDYFDGKKSLKTVAEFKYGDSNYLRLFHIPIVAGRRILPSDTVKEMIINQTYTNVLGFKKPEDALGKYLDWDGKKVPIVGVMKDFYSHPLTQDIAPMTYTFSGKDSRNLIVALQPQSADGLLWENVIAKLESTYKKSYPDEKFSYVFFDESIAVSYLTEQKTSHLLKWAAGLTVFISCLGLLGLVIYTTNRRAKEIGVRKVLGASVTQVFSILSRDFLRLVCIAFILAIPVAWWALHKWLQNFSLRTEMSWWIFFISGLGMIAVALITISVQTIRAARANPVNSLRTD